jgi:ubiquinone/menaquinone biosynthesis C-methylase UbiE
MALSRELEPEVMDSELEALEYDQMLFHDVNLAFALRALTLTSTGRFLDLGTGTAQVPILILQNSPSEIYLDAIDMSTSMIKLAQKNVVSSQTSDKIGLVVGDAKRLPFRRHTFDMVVSNSLVHHLPDATELLREVSRVLKPTGGLLIRDLIRPESEQHMEELVTRYTPGASICQGDLFRSSLRAALTMDEVSDSLRKVFLERVRLVQSSNRHWSLERTALK